jgi:acetyl esterase/lipase
VDIEQGAIVSYEFEEQYMASPQDQSGVSPWMGDIDPSQLGFPFALDKSLYSKEIGIVYKETAKGPQHLDLYRPAARQQKAPLVVMIHGGGWSQGGRFEMGLSKWAGYLASAGMVVASIDYRLAPETSFPDSFEDCLDAVDWIATRAEEFGADPERIGLWGDSAGGHLVLLVATSQTHPEYSGPRMQTPGENLKGVVAWYPPTDMLEMHRAESRALGAGTVQNFVGSAPETDPERWRQVSPIENVHGELPPTLILQGTRDVLVPHDQAIRYTEKLDAAGAPHELHIVEGAVHGFDRVAPDERAKELIERSRSFLIESLGITTWDSVATPT